MYAELATANDSPTKSPASARESKALMVLCCFNPKSSNTAITFPPPSDILCNPKRKTLNA